MVYRGFRRSRQGDGVSAGLYFGDAKRSPPSISKADSAFESDGVEFCWGASDIDLAQLNDLFEKVGFPRRNTVNLEKALEATHTILSIKCTKQSRWARKGQLLGFARANSDGALTATIWDVAVHPAWQRIGLGRALVERLVLSLHDAEIDVIALYAEPQVVVLYEKLGFVKDARGLQGMAFQKTSQEGRALIAAAVAQA